MTTEMDEQRDVAEKILRNIAVIQYVAPFILVLLALLIPHVADLGDQETSIVVMLYVVAIVEFFVIRFVLLRRLQKAFDKRYHQE